MVTGDGGTGSGRVCGLFARYTQKVHRKRGQLRGSKRWLYSLVFVVSPTDKPGNLNVADGRRRILFLAVVLRTPYWLPIYERAFLTYGVVTLILV